MRNVVYVVPAPAENSLRFVDALRGLENVRILGIINRRPEGLSPDVGDHYDHVVQVDDCFNADQVEWAVRGFSNLYGPIHRLTAALEQLQPCMAEVRRRAGIAGMLPDAVARFTDKNVMKAALREHGLPCAKSIIITSGDEAHHFAEEVGFPIIIKPPVGAGCKETYQARNTHELVDALREIRASAERPVQLEEFITGEENSFDTITVGGQVKLTNVTHYFPTVIDAVRNPWIQYAILMPREVDRPETHEILDIGSQAVVKLGMESGFTHMEWFRKPDGRAVISEVAARPPGVQIVPMLSYAHEVDFTRVWARAVVDDAFDGPFERKYACGVVFLRGTGSGWVTEVEGIEEISRSIGHHIVDARLPQRGIPKSAHYEGEGHIIVRAPETATVKSCLDRILSTIRIRYSH